MIAPPEDFRLDHMERASALWLKLERYLNAELDQARLANDVVQPEGETARLRGKIAALKALLRLGQQEMPPKRRLNEASTPQGAHAK